MLFNNRAKKEQEEAAANSGALPVQHNIGGSLFAPSINPRPTRLNLHIETAQTAPLQVEEPSLVEEGFHTNPPESFDPASFEPAWLSTQTPTEAVEAAAPVWTNDAEIPQFPSWTAPAESASAAVPAEGVWEPSQEFSFNETTPASPWESRTPQADIFSSNTPGDPANWHENLSELNEPSPEPLGLEVALPWATSSEAPAFSVPEVPTDNGPFQPTAAPFISESETFNFNAYEQPLETFQATTTPPENHFLDSVNEQLYPSDTFPTESFQAQEPKAKVLPPLSPTASADPWTESANQFNEASQYLFPEDSKLTGGAQNWYEQDSSDVSKTPSAIYWPEEVLNSEMLELGTSVQDNLSGLQELNNEPSSYTLPIAAGTTLPEFDFPTQSQPEIETLSYDAATGLEFSEANGEIPSDFSWSDSPSDWESTGTESSLENASWVFPSTPESEPSFTLGSNEDADVWNTPISDSPQSDFFATPQTPGSSSSWGTSSPSTNDITSQNNEQWTSPLDRGAEEPSYSINTDSPETNLFEFPSDENLWYGTETTTHVQTNDPFMASAPPMEASQLEPPTLKTDTPHYQEAQTPSFVSEETQIPETSSAESNSKLGKLDILGVCPLPENHRLLVVHNGEVYALMGQNNTADDSQIAVLHVFDRNPLAYQSTFAVIKDTRPDRVGHMIVQAGSIRGQISIEQGKIMWHGETS